MGSHSEEEDGTSWHNFPAAPQNSEEGFPLLHEGVHLIEYDIGETRISPDGPAVKQLSSAQVIGIVAKNLTLAGGGPDILCNAEENRNILIAVQPIGNEERHNHDIFL